MDNGNEDIVPNGAVTSESLTSLIDVPTLRSHIESLLSLLLDADEAHVKLSLTRSSQSIENLQRFISDPQFNVLYIVKQKPKDSIQSQAGKKIGYF